MFPATVHPPMTLPTMTHLVLDGDQQAVVLVA